MPAHYAAQAELPTGQKSSYEKAPPHNSVQTAQDEPALHQPVYCMLFLQVSGAHLQPLPVTWCRNLTAILRSASQFEPRSSTIHIPLLCRVKALKQNKQNKWWKIRSRLHLYTSYNALHNKKKTDLPWGTRKGTGLWPHCRFQPIRSRLSDDELKGNMMNTGDTLTRSSQMTQTCRLRNQHSLPLLSMRDTKI